MKKLLAGILSFACALGSVGLVACGADRNPSDNPPNDLSDASFDDFKYFRKEFAIEGLEDGSIPQGLAAYYGQYQEGVDANDRPITKTQQYFLTSAYMNDGSPSRIFVTGEVTGYEGYVTTLNEDGTPHLGHVGGIATNGSKLWVAYNDSVKVARASEEYKNSNILSEIVDKAKKNSKLEEGEELHSIQFTSSFKVNGDVAYLCYFHDPRYATVSYDRLYVGEFYCNGNYETDESHRIETPSGYKNTSFMYEYCVDGNTDNEYGLYLIDSDGSDKALSENVPKIQKIYSLPEKIQGLAFSNRSGYGAKDGMLVLSQSYGLSNSHLLCFDWNKMNANSTKYTSLTGGISFEYNGVYRISGDKKTPYCDPNLLVYYADKNDKNMFIRDYSIPAMSEGMCTITPLGSRISVQSRIYVLFSSGSKIYDATSFARLKNIYSFIPK